MIDTQDTNIEYEGDGVTREFYFAFRILSEDNLAVYVGEGSKARKTLGEEYSLEGWSRELAGGTVVFDEAPEDGVSIRLVRETRLLQPVDFKYNDELPSETLERAVDRPIAIAQEMNARIEDLSLLKVDEALAEAKNAAADAREAAEGLEEAETSARISMAEAAKSESAVKNAEKRVRASEGNAADAAERAEVSANTARLGASSWKMVKDYVVDELPSSASRGDIFLMEKTTPPTPEISVEKINSVMNASDACAGEDGVVFFAANSGIYKISDPSAHGFEQTYERISTRAAQKIFYLGENWLVCIHPSYVFAIDADGGQFRVLQSVNERYNIEQCFQETWENSVLITAGMEEDDTDPEDPRPMDINASIVYLKEGVPQLQDCGWTFMGFAVDSNEDIWAHDSSGIYRVNIERSGEDYNFRVQPQTNNVYPAHCCPADQGAVFSLWRDLCTESGHRFHSLENIPGASIETVKGDIWGRCLVSHKTSSKSYEIFPCAPDEEEMAEKISDGELLSFLGMPTREGAYVLVRKVSGTSVQRYVHGGFEEVFSASGNLFTIPYGRGLKAIIGAADGMHAIHYNPDEPIPENLYIATVTSRGVEYAEIPDGSDFRVLNGYKHYVYADGELREIHDNPYQDASDVHIQHTPTNYSASSNSLEEHSSGIDNAIGSIKSAVEGETEERTRDVESVRAALSNKADAVELFNETQARRQADTLLDEKIENKSSLAKGSSIVEIRDDGTVAISQGSGYSNSVLMGNIQSGITGTLVNGSKLMIQSLDELAINSLNKKPIEFGGSVLTGLANGVNPTDAVNFQQLGNLLDPSKVTLIRTNADIGSTDLNNFVNTGIYLVNSDHHPNGPTPANYLFLLVLKNSFSVIQLCWNDVTKKQYQRFRYSSTWSEWVEIADSAALNALKFVQADNEASALQLSSANPGTPYFVAES